MVAGNDEGEALNAARSDLRKRCQTWLEILQSCSPECFDTRFAARHRCGYAEGGTDLLGRRSASSVQVSSLPSNRAHGNSRKDSRMPAIFNTLARLAARLSGRRITLRFTMDARIAEYAAPLIERLIADTDDGDTYRAAIADWRSAERPPICIHSAEISTVWAVAEGGRHLPPPGRFAPLPRCDCSSQPDRGRCTAPPHPQGDRT